MAVKFTRVDLDFILQQILMAEAGQSPVNPLLSFGLREVAGTNNNLVPGQTTYGSTDQVFPTATDPLLQNAQYGTSYSSTSGLVVDAQPRMISNLIADQTANNPAALAAQEVQRSFLGAGYQNTTTPGADGLYGATTAYIVTDTGADGLYGTADDTIVEFGKDGLHGTTDDVTGLAGDLLHNIATGADGKYGATTKYVITSKGQDGIFGTADDVIDEFGANGMRDGNVAGGDDIIGTRGSLLHTLSAGIYGTASALSATGVTDLSGFQTVAAGADGTWGTSDDILTNEIVTDDVVSDDVVSGNEATPTDASSSSSAIPGLAQSLFINNVTPDNGLSAPSNSWFTFFGQFFDHGLDMIDKGGNGTVFIMLSPDDPLYVPGSPTNFMVLTRATDLPGPDGKLGTADDVHQGTNQTSPFIDQSQTYASDPSHQVFLREYMIGADGNLHSTGAMLSHHNADGTTTMATWADLKLQALTMFGIKLTDADVGNVPLLATDAYGNFIAGANGQPQLVVRNLDGTTGLMVGDPGNPIAVPGNAFRTGHAFINDMAHAASPTDDFGNPLKPDTDTIVGQFNASGTAADPAMFYDNELLDAHYVAGDGRVNENIGLTAVQEIFHSEHNRLLAQVKQFVQDQLNAGDTSFAGNWVLPGIDLTTPSGFNADGTPIPHVIADDEWNGERLFQAAKFGNETEYQHLVFEEFARYVAPSVHVAGGVNVHIDPAITSEFANVVYRFGHSMLDENVNIYQIGADGKPMIGADGQPMMTQEGLIQAFTNPTKFASDPNMTADIVLGTVNQVSNAIDEFVTGSLRNNLLGLPLDLAALNIARGRDTGVAPLNLVRNQLYAQTGEAQLKAYVSWADFGSQLKHPESLINFIAAYGTHDSILHIRDAMTGLVRDTTMAERRAAAANLVHKGTIGDAFNPADMASVDAYNFMHSQGIYANLSTKIDAKTNTSIAQGNPLTIHDAAGNEAAWSTGSVTGVDNIDMWIGGLAEKINLFGGMLGSTFEYIFRTQMEALQDADRLYYLPRIEGMDYEEALQDSSLAQLIRANTNSELHLPGNVFLTPEYTIEASDYFVKATGNDKADAQGFKLDDAGQRIVTDSSTWLQSAATLPDGSHKTLVNVLPDGTVQFLGDDNFLGNTIVLGGTDGNDRLTAGAADDDTIWGEGGDDVIDGGGGADFLFGGAGNDTIIGGQGDDIMHGDAGNDTMYGGDGIDNIFGGDGNDYIEGGRGDDIILGGLGNDIIIGNEGNDELTGGEGDDWLESKGGQGQLMFGDSGAPTGGVPLYSGNDVMIGGVAGGDVMKGFSGDDIMVGQGSFTKFIGGLGFDWGSYEFAPHGVSEDMNRKEFISPNGSEDSIRDIWQHTEGASGSQFDDIIIGSNATRLLLTKDTLDNVNLISGLQSFFAPGPVSFGGGDIILGGGGNDQIAGGAGDDIIEGDAFLHVALTSYSAGGQIIRQINYDPNANRFDPAALLLPGGVSLMSAAFLANVPLSAAGGVDPVFANLQASGALPANPGNMAHATNVDTAVFNDVFANYGSDFGLFGGAVGDPAFDGVTGLDAEGFLTIRHTGVKVVVGGNPQGLAGIDDGTDRIRGIERLQFADGTVAIDPYGNILSWSFSQIADPYAVALGGIDPYYDAVPVGTPTITETGGLDPATTVNVGQTLTANLTAIADAAGVNHVALTDADGIASKFSYQWQENDLLRGQWADITGATGSDYKVAPFFEGALGIRVKVSYVDGKGYKETVTSASTAAVTGGPGNTAPTIVTAQQFNGVANTTALIGKPFTFYSPFSSIFTDAQTAPAAMTYAATLADGSSLDSIGLRFTFDPVTGSGEFTSAVDGGDGVVGVFDTQIPGGPAPTGVDDDIARPWNPDPGQYAIRVLAKDQGGLAVSSTFTINVLPADTAPIAKNESYSILEDATLAVTAVRLGVLANDTDPDSGDRLTAQLVSGPAHGTLELNKDGTFVYTPTLNYTGTDFFTYVAKDVFLASSNLATASITVTPKTHVVTAALVNDTGASSTDGVTKDATLAGKGFANAAVFAAVDGAAAVRFATADAAGNWSGKPVQANGSQLIDGLHTIVISETNGNPGPDLGRTDNATVSFTLDTTPPTVTVALANDTGRSKTDGISSDPTLSGTGEPNASVSVTITDITAAHTPNVIVVPIQADTTGAWSITPGTTQDVPKLSDGSYTVSATETDLAGNTGSAALATLILDTVAPTTPTIAGLTYTTNLTPTSETALTSYTIFGTAEANTILTVATTPVGGTTTTLKTVTSAADGSWTATVTSVAPPSNFSTTLTVTATDVAGNVSGGASQGVIVGTGTPVNTANNTLSAAGSSIPNLILGLGGNDTLTGGSGNDILDGGLGIDTMAGGAGNDTYIVDSVKDVIAETAGNGTDTIRTILQSFSLAFTAANPGLANVENLTFIGAGAFIGTGNALSNVITGGAGADSLTDGTGGVDTLIGGAGDDTYNVSNIGDVIVELAGGGTDIVRTKLASYVLDANVENLTYTDAGNFTGTGNILANVITGGAGNDTLDGGVNTTGRDTLIGGAGDDTYIVRNANDIVTEDARAGKDTVQTALAKYALATNVENLTYTGADTFAGTGNNLANVITGGAGADTLDGGANTTGIDTLIGGAGNDTYIVRNVGDVVTETAGGGTDTEVTALVSLTLAANVENLTYTGAGAFTGTGNGLANVITGGVGNDTLAGGTNTAGVGADTLTGGSGNDIYIVSNAGDVITELAGGGTDTVRTALGSFTLAANVENLTYIGVGTFAGTGNNLGNVITGGGAADTLDGGVNTTGIDTLIGGAGNDTYIVRNVGDVVTETVGGGIDTVQTTLNSYTLGSNLENLTFIGTGSFTGTGNGLANVITGGAGADLLNGGGGNDTLVGGAGVDTLTGGAGADIFFLVKGDANGDLITDFTKGSDVIQLSGYGTGATLAPVAGTTNYAVKVGGVQVDTFRLTGNITLLAGTDYKFV